MGVDDAAHDREPQARAPLAAFTTFVPKTVKHVREVFRGDPNPSVLYRKADLRGVGFSSESNVAAGPRELERVGQEIGESLDHSLRVRPGSETLRRRYSSLILQYVRRDRARKCAGLALGDRPELPERRSGVDRCGECVRTARGKVTGEPRFRPRTNSELTVLPS